jgi:hypothetical protein
MYFNSISEPTGLKHYVGSGMIGVYQIKPNQACPAAVDTPASATCGTPTAGASPSSLQDNSFPIQ